MGTANSIKELAQKIAQNAQNFPDEVKALLQHIKNGMKYVTITALVLTTLSTLDINLYARAYTNNEQNNISVSSSVTNNQKDSINYNSPIMQQTINEFTNQAITAPYTEMLYELTDVVSAHIEDFSKSPMTIIDALGQADEDRGTILDGIESITKAKEEQTEIEERAKKDLVAKGLAAKKGSGKGKPPESDDKVVVNEDSIYDFATNTFLTTKYANNKSVDRDDDR